MIFYQYTKTDKDLEEILELQQKNLAKNLTKKEQIEQGFVTIEHNFKTLKKLHTIYPHSIAKKNNKVIGYALSMDKNCKEYVGVLKPMFYQIDTVYNKNYIVMGQICIDKNYRGKGIFKNLYSFMIKFFKTHFNAIITEIDSKNIRSLQAHQSIGFRELKKYKYQNQNWSIVKLNI